MAYYHVTVAGADTKTGADWAHAMDWAAFETYYEGTPADGDIIYFKSGAADGSSTYTVGAALDGSASADGTAIAPISIIGVKYATTNEGANVVLSDWGSGTDRPIFSQGANSITLGDYTKVFSCVFSGTSHNCPKLGKYNVLYNCKCSTNSASNRGIVGSDNGYCLIIACEIYGAGGGAHTGISSATNNFLIFNYIHDVATGASITSSSASIFNVFDTCATAGITVAANYQFLIANNTFYNCAISVSGSTGYCIHCINNIIDTATDGFKWTTQTDINFFAYNHVGNSVTDMYDGVEEAVAAHKDNLVTGGAGDDPEFNDEANGDFKLAATSPCIDAGMSLTLGCSTASEMNQGAWEATTAAASGSSPRFGDMTGGLK